MTKKLRLTMAVFRSANKPLKRGTHAANQTGAVLLVPERQARQDARAPNPSPAGGGTLVASPAGEAARRPDHPPVYATLVQPTRTRRRGKLLLCRVARSRPLAEELATERERAAEGQGRGRAGGPG